jgi:hypothetical protein
MKTHSTADDCSPAANLPEDKQHCRPGFVCGQWTCAGLERGPGMMVVVAAAVAEAAAL